MITPDEMDTLVKLFQAKIEEAKTQLEKKGSKSFFDRSNLIVNVLAFICIPIGVWVLTLQITNLKQSFDLSLAAIVSNFKDTYVDKPTFTTTVSDIKDRIDRVDGHLDSVDNRENNDKSTEDLKIQSLQDREHLSSLSTTNTYDP